MGPLYHNPIFTQAVFNPLTLSGSISLGNVVGDSMLYQFQTFDYESDNVSFSLSNVTVPGDITINANTGWLTGFIDRDNALLTPYTFDVTAYKSVSPNYATTLPVTLTIQNPLNESIQWGNTNLGNVTPGIPSTLSITANVIQPFMTPISGGAEASCTLKLVDATILNGGTNFFIGNSILVLGGFCNSNAIITVANVTPLGTITAISISPSIQQYSALPNLTFVWPNPNDNIVTPAYGAVLQLQFGVDSINITNGGEFYDTATVGFGYTGESITATANVIILNGVIQSIPIDIDGYGYNSVPPVIIRGKAFVSASNPIKYEIIGGNIPTGLDLLTNGLLVGKPSSQYFSLDSDTEFDASNTAFDSLFTVKVLASVGVNKAAYYSENDLFHPSSGDVNYTQDFQTLIQSEQELSITLHNNVPAVVPKTNLSLEFLLNDADYNTLYAPLNDETIVSNSDIYRNGDFYYGVAPHTRILMAYGISALIPDNIVSAVSAYHHDKRFLLSNLKLAISTTDGYEVIYILPTDEFTANNKSFMGSIITSGNFPPLTIDSEIFDADATIYRAGDVNQAIVYPATIANMINQLNEKLSAFDNDFLPTWMTDVQPNGQILGFVPAIPLVYLTPNTGLKTMFYLQQYYNNNGGLNTIEAVTDRYVWDAGYSLNWNPYPLVAVTGNNSLGNLIAPSNFTVNVAVPVTYTSNLTPRTFAYTGNTVINLPGEMPSIFALVDAINSYKLDGFAAVTTANNNITLENTYGCPFILYDGNNAPLSNIGISSGLYSNAIASTWYEQVVTSFSDAVQTLPVDAPLPPAPFIPGPGQQIGWLVPTSISYYDSGSFNSIGSYSGTVSSNTANATGVITKHASATLGGYTGGITWGDFQTSSLTPLPPGANISGIYPVIAAVQHTTSTFNYKYYGYGANIVDNSLGGWGETALDFISPFDPNGLTISWGETVFYGASIGTNIANITFQNIGVNDSSSVSLAPYSPSDSITVTAVGYAIYYTSNAYPIVPTLFDDLPLFVDVSDTFLTDDANSVYIKFPVQNFITEGIVTV